ncbi:MAG: DUF262 domain-containing protein [Nitrospirales bacterium]
MSVSDEVAKQRNDVQFDTYTTTWREIIGQYKDKELIIDPEYQRLFRWSVDQQTQYIESILLGIPSPPLFLAQNQDGRAEVIDGLQRISTLIKFFAEEIFSWKPTSGVDAEEQDTNNIMIPAKLVGGPIVPSLEDFTAATLPEALVRTIKYARITIIILEKESSIRARYEVFRRLNKFGSVLSDQEIRNCTSRLFDGEFPTQLRELARRSAIRDALSLNEDFEKQMGVEEVLLRLLAFNYSQKPLKHEIREYLDDFMVVGSEGKFKLSKDIAERIEATFELIGNAQEKGSAFRFPKQGFSTNLFDIVATGVFHNLEGLTPAAFRDKLNGLIGSPELRQLTGAGSNTRKKLEGRIALGKAWFSN